MGPAATFRLTSLLKRCCACRNVFPIAAFGRDRRRDWGLAPICRHCRTVNRHKYRDDGRCRSRDVIRALRRLKLDG